MTTAGGGPEANDANDASWPVELRGVTESVVTTLGPNDRWNVAALGLRAPDSVSEPVTATTWGNTRTRRNFHRRGSGVVQFVADPRDFVDAALTVREEDEPVLDSADAWVEVAAERLDGGESAGTRWETWALRPVESEIRRTRVPTVNRGFYAVVDATVAASRLDVPSYDTDALLERLAYFAETVEKCGGPADREAFDRLSDVTGWRRRLE
jgi:hypothetical protein